MPPSASPTGSVLILTSDLHDPGSYWLQAIFFKLFGISLLTARWIVIIRFFSAMRWCSG